MYKINDRALPAASLKPFYSCSEYLPYIQNVRYHRVTNILESWVGAACEKQKIKRPDNFHVWRMAICLHTYV